MPHYGSKLDELSINPVCACVCLPGCRFHGCLPAFASSTTLALRRLWISLIIIGCVMETCGGRCPPLGGLLRMNTVWVCEQVYDNVCHRVSFMNCHSCVRQLLEGLHSARAPPLSSPLKTCPLFLYTKNYWHSLSQTLRASHNYRVWRLHLRIYANSFRSPSRTVWGDDGNRHLNAFKFLCVCFLVDIGWCYEEHFISSRGTSFWHKPGRMQ